MTVINNDKDSPMNRGVELILRRRTPKEKTFSLMFEKLISLFKKEITIHFNFFLDVRNIK